MSESEGQVSTVDRDGKVAVISGASRGIGRAIAKRLGVAGMHTVLLARTTGALEELDDEIRAEGGPKALLVPIDLKELDRIDPLGPALYERYGKVDYLIGCAATLGTLAPLGHLEEKAWRSCMTVNAEAHFRILRSLDPLLRQSAGAKAVFLTDRKVSEGPAYWSAYCASKAALEAMVTCYAKESQTLDIDVQLLTPPPTRTALRAQAYPGETPDLLNSPDTTAAKLIQQIFASESLAHEEAGT